MYGAIDLSGAERMNRIASGKQPSAMEHPPLCAGFPPPGAQTLQQYWREHGVAVLLSFALFDPQDHALAIDVSDL